MQLLIVADTVVDLTTSHFRRVTVCVVAHKVCSAARTSARYSELERRSRALEDQNLDKTTNAYISTTKLLAFSSTWKSSLEARFLPCVKVAMRD